ncbi:MAG TPA: L-serine ammonia-lyase, iron-sulfur-dependent, subunit alpha [Methanocellaceae archaeon]
MDKEIVLKALKSEIERSVGCTDPGAVCLAVYRAAQALGCKPERVAVTVSSSVYKNGINVGVPGTGMRGLHIAAALGAVLDHGDRGLAMLDGATENDIKSAISMVSGDSITIGHIETTDPLYIKALATAGDNNAYAIITGDYTNVVEVALNGRIIYSSPAVKAETAQAALKGHTLAELFATIETMTVDDLDFLLEAAEINRQAAYAGLASPSSRLGKGLSSMTEDMPAPFAAYTHAQQLTAAACEARMSGMQVPVIAIAGSGNHGIANFLGVLASAEALGRSRDQLARALAISSLVTVVIKGYSMRLSAFCGCAVSASAGVAAGVTYLLGGSYEDSVHAMQSVIGTLAGMVCDGAKESCAFKLSSSVALAVQFSYLALDGAYIPSGMGMLGSTIEKTFENLGQLNNPGMVAADRLLLNMIAGRPA